MKNTTLTVVVVAAQGQQNEVVILTETWMFGLGAGQELISIE